MHGVDVHPSLFSLPLLMSHRTQDYLWGLGRRGIPPPSQYIPWLGPPRAQAPRVESSHRASLTVVGPLYPSRLSRGNKHTGRGSVVISSIKYSIHLDIRSLLSHLIGWLTLVSIWIARSLKIRAWVLRGCKHSVILWNLSSLTASDWCLFFLSGIFYIYQ